jgi:hypothetical protein
VRRRDRYCGLGCPCVCRNNGRARRAGTCATAKPNIINLNQYDDGNPYDYQFDSLRTLSEFLH